MNGANRKNGGKLARCITATTYPQLVNKPLTNHICVYISLTILYVVGEFWKTSRKEEVNKWETVLIHVLVILGTVYESWG